MDNPLNFWENRYAEAAYVYGMQPNAYFKEQLDTLDKPGRLLLLAEGEGRNAVYAAQKGWQVTAVDFSEQAKAKALALAAERVVEIDYHVADILQFDFGQDESWDMIGLIYAHFKPDDRLNIHRKCVHALRKDGRLVLEAFNPRQAGRSSGGPKDPGMLYSKRLLEQDFEKLNLLSAVELTIMLDEGNGHKGEGEVVRMHLNKK